MKSVFGADPGFGYACRTRPDGRHSVLEHVLLIHILILSSRLYCPGPDVSRMCFPDPLPPCLYSEAQLQDAANVTLRSETPSRNYV